MFVNEKKSSMEAIRQRCDDICNFNQFFPLFSVLICFLLIEYIFCHILRLLQFSFIFPALIDLNPAKTESIFSLVEQLSSSVGNKF